MPAIRQLLASEGVIPLAEARALLAETDDDPTDPAALDETYAEAQVMFGPDPDAGCPGSRDILARMDMPARPAAPAGAARA